MQGLQRVSGEQTFFVWKALADAPGRRSGTGDGGITGGKQEIVASLKKEGEIVCQDGARKKRRLIFSECLLNQGFAELGSFGLARILSLRPGFQ